MEPDINEEVDILLDGEDSFEDNYLEMLNDGVDLRPLEEYRINLNNRAIQLEKSGASETEVADVRRQYGLKPPTIPKDKVPYVTVVNDVGTISYMDERQEVLLPDEPSTTGGTLSYNEATRNNITNKYVEDYYLPKIKDLDPNGYVGAFDKGQLVAAGYDKRTIDSIEANLRDKAFLPDEGLESDIVLPITPEFKLANKLMEPVMKGLGNAGAYLWRSWQTRGIPRAMIKSVEAGDKEAIATYIQTVEQLKDLKLGGEVFKGGSISGNLFQQQQYADNVLSKSLVTFGEKLKSAAPNSPKLADDFAQVVTGLEQSMLLETKHAYKKMDSLASDFMYNIKPLKENINKKLTDASKGVPEQAIKDIERVINYKARTMSPAEKGAISRLKELDSEINSVANKLKINKNPKQKGSLTNQLNALKKEKKAQQEIVPDVNYIKENEFIHMIQRINAHLSGSKMGLSTHDKQVRAGLEGAKRIIDQEFEALTKQHNPAMYNQFKAAQGKASELFKTFGRDGKRTEIGKILDTDDYSTVLNSILENPHKVGAIGKQLDALKPGMGEDFAVSWLNRKLKNVKNVKGDMFSTKRVDTSSAADTLNTVVSDDATMQVVKDLLGESKVTQLNSLASIANGLEKTTKALGVDGPLKDGLREYIKQTPNIAGQTGRAIELVYDKTRDVIARTYEKTPMKWLTQVPGLSDFISKKAVADTKTLKRLTGYIENVGLAKESQVRKVFETKLGAEMAAILKEEDILNEQAVPIAETMLSIGIAPAVVYKTLGIAVGTVAYGEIARIIDEKIQEPDIAESDTNIFSTFKKITKFIKEF